MMTEHEGEVLSLLEHSRAFVYPIDGAERGSYTTPDHPSSSYVGRNYDCKDRD